MILCLPFVVSSKDNPAQQKAREAARAQKWPPQTAEKPAAPEAPPSATEPNKSTPPSAIVAGAEDTEAQKKAREVVREETASAPSAPAPTPAPASVAPSPTGLASGPRPDTEAQALARAALHEAPVIVIVKEVEEGDLPEQASTPLAGGPRPDTEAQAEAREAIRGEHAMVAPVATAETQPKEPQPKPVRQKTVAKRKTQSNPLFEGLEMPEPAFTPEQEAALAELMDPYATDKISTEEYHLKRSAIIAGS